MSSAAVVCPHCGTRQARDVGERSKVDEALAARKKASEANSKPTWPATSAANSAAATAGAFPLAETSGRADTVASIFLPSARGKYRFAEVALTIVALPLLVFTVVVLAFASYRARFLRPSWRGASMFAVPLCAIMGFTYLSVGGFSAVPTFALTAMIAAWIARAILRSL